MTTERRDDPESQWFWSHYEQAAEEVIAFLAGAGASLHGREVADVGCGDGIIDLGLAHRAFPARLTGFDINPVDVEGLQSRAVAQGVDATMPAGLEFRESSTARLPAEDGSYDWVVTWSAFEHVREPVGLLQEMRRILRPDGGLFLQLWPFFHSERGSHLWDWYREGFPNLLYTEDEVAATLRADPKPNAGFTEYMLEEYRHLNRITADELQNSLLAAGFHIARFEFYAHTVEVPKALMRYPLSVLGIAGIKLIARPA